MPVDLTPVRVDRIDTQCACGYPITAEISLFRPQKPRRFWRRPPGPGPLRAELALLPRGTPDDPSPRAALHRCPNCQRLWPALTAAEFLLAIQE
jgi:hypothetical protein